MGKLIFEISQIPDRTYPRYNILAQGDVVTAVGKDFERLLRAVSGLPPGSASLSIRFKFNPKPKGGGIQSRLRIYLIAQCLEPKLEESVRLLITQGALRRFYEPESITDFKAPWNLLTAACDVVRREDSLPPLYTDEFNDRIPASYRTFTSFKQNNRNDYLELDSVLSEISELVIIDICVQPTELTSEILAHTRYLSQLQSINRNWERDEENDSDILDTLGDETGSWRTRIRELKPLRYTDPLADDILRCQQRFHDTLRESHLLFHIRVLSESPEVARLVGSLTAGLAFADGTYALRFCTKGGKTFREALRSVKESRVLLLHDSKKSYDTGDKPLYSGLRRLTQLATVQELLGLFRLPVASLASPRCIRKNSDPRIEDLSDLVVLGEDQEVSGLYRGPTFASLAKMLAIFGMPGYGKTTAAINLMLQAYDRGIPFIVIETAKTEYRILKILRDHPEDRVRKLARAMEVYTPGNENVSPVRVNPMEIQQGISVDEHIGDILDCFYAAMPLDGPLQALLIEALERVYEEWIPMGIPPLISDLVGAAHRVLDEKKYSEDTDANIRSALEVRIGALTHLGIGKVFQSRKSIPSFDHFFKVPAVLELDCLPRDQRNLLTLLYISLVRGFAKTTPITDMVPRYMIFIEEAHNVVGRNTDASLSPDVADSKVFAADAVSRALLEFRGLGVAVVIIDQFPSRVAPEVIKATTTKLTFRLTHREDREEIAAAMAFGSIEPQEIAHLRTGDAYIITESFYEPRKIRTVDLHDRFRLS